MQTKKTQSQNLKLWIIIVMIVIFFSCQTFAADCNQDSLETLTVIHEFIWNLWRFFSWIWIVLSNFAGVLMTNTMVYWEFMGLDVSLWNIWQISRSIANYTLWFMFLYKIFKYIFIPSEKSPIKQIKDFLLASVFIQASWFLVMVLFDLSTIILATVSSFPSQVIDSSSEVMTAVQQQVAKDSVLSNDKKTVIINAFTDSYLQWDNTKWFSVESSTTTAPWSEVVTPEKKTLDSLLPQTYNLWGTFLYLWFTAMKAQDYVVRPMPTAASCEDRFLKVITWLIFDSWLIILYSLSLAILIVLLIMRLAYLWVFIAISPLVVLLYFIKDIDIGKKNDILDLKKAIYLIFQPAIYAFWMGLMFLFVVMVQNVFSNSAESELWSTVSVSQTKKSSTTIDPIPKINSSLENSWLVGFYLREWAKSLKDILLSLITLVLMWELIKVALTWSMWDFNAGWAFSRRMNTLVDRTGRFFWSIWVVPTPEGAMWFNQVWDSRTNSSPLLNEAEWRLERRLIKRDKSQEIINKLLWKPNARNIQSLTDTQVRIHITPYLWNNTAEPKKFVAWLMEIKKENSWLIFSNVQNYVDDWINKYSWYTDRKSNEFKQMSGFFWGDSEWETILDSKQPNENLSIEKIFTGKNWDFYFKAFYKNVLGEENEPPKSYSEFMKNWWRISYTKPSSS